MKKKYCNLDILVFRLENDEMKRGWREHAEIKPFRCYLLDEGSTGEFTERVREMSSQLCVTLFTLSVFPLHPKTAETTCGGKRGGIVLEAHTFFNSSF